MTVRLREAHALAEGRELRQRVVELETQVREPAQNEKWGVTLSSLASALPLPHYQA